ncbi:MAG: hypothetical protein ABIQ95_09525 [Bdellovibrionia bacterium]
MDRKIVELLISGKGINRLAQDLHVCKRRVRKLREQANAAGYLSGIVCLPPVALSEVEELLFQHREWIKDRLQVGWVMVAAKSIFKQFGDFYPIPSR